MLDFFKRWGIFIRERFEPISHFVMIGCLFSANALLSLDLFAKTSQQVVPLNPGILILSFAISFLFFFHLRLFDEWKDYEVDKNINQTRPLPRGLIPIPEYKIVTSAVLILEGLLAFSVSTAAFLTWTMAVAYSLLMLKEFFIGSWLRPKMEIYAASHTLVSALVALFIFTAVTSQSIGQTPKEYLFVMLINWMIFNVFEFARKTFGREEERVHVESYSLRLGSWGAVALVWASMGFALLGIWKILPRLEWPISFRVGILLITALVFLTSISFGFKNSSSTAKIYRRMSSFYLVGFNMIIAVAGYLALF